MLVWCIVRTLRSSLTALSFTYVLLFHLLSRTCMYNAHSCSLSNPLFPSLPLSLSLSLSLRGSQTPNTTLLPAPPTTKSTTPHSLRPEWALRGLRLVRPHFASGETEETKKYQVQLKQHVCTYTYCVLVCE